MEHWKNKGFFSAISFSSSGMENLEKVNHIDYDKVSANIASSVPKTSKFQSGRRAVKLVLNT